MIFQTVVSQIAVFQLVEVVKKLTNNSEVLGSGPGAGSTPFVVADPVHVMLELA